jgi:hypothetical protein
MVRCRFEEERLSYMVQHRRTLLLLLSVSRGYLSFRDMTRDILVCFFSLIQGRFRKNSWLLRLNRFTQA